MRAAADLAGFDAMLDQTLDALARRARGDVSFASEGEAEGVDELWQLVELAREDGDSMPSFEAGEADDGAGPLARAGRECKELFEDALQALSSRAVIETGPSSTQIRTHVGWTGDAVTHALPGASAQQVATHAAAMQATLAASVRRLRLVTTIVSAAGRIAVIIATPAGAVKALPIAYRCVRDLYERWSALRTDSTQGETSWQ